jgi:hypothetical protein
MNERHVATIKATLPRRKEANKNVWIWRLSFSIVLFINHWRIWRWHFSLNGDLSIGVVVVCNVVENKCGLRFMTWARVITTTTIMTMRPLPNYNLQKNDLPN